MQKFLVHNYVMALGGRAKFGRVWGGMGRGGVERECKEFACVSACMHAHSFLFFGFALIIDTKSGKYLPFCSICPPALGGSRCRVRQSWGPYH